MRPRALLDTNVLVYAYDRSEPTKQQQALSLLKSARTLRLGTLSSQVLSEFYSVATRKIMMPLTPGEARERLQVYASSWPVLPVTGPIVVEASRGVCERSLSFWDALLWATARLYQLPLILSEDFPTGSIVEGVTFVDPFAPNFRPESWLG